MNMEIFVEMVKNSVKEKLGQDYQIRAHKVNKNNGVKYVGLDLRKNGEIVTPVVYLNDYFEQYKNGRATIMEIANYIVKSVKMECPNIDVRQFFNYKNVRKKIIYRIINTERNKELLKDLPHIEYMDLSIVFKVLVSQEYMNTATILVNNEHMKLWDVTVEDLYKDAGENTQRLERYELRSLSEVLCGIMKAEALDEYNYDKDMKDITSSVPMYVLSNKNGVEGAVCMLYSDVIRNFSERIDCNLYIIPSSIHELLLLPTIDTKESEEIRNMIKEVNDTQVSPEDILSYSVYYYNREEDKICIL